MSELFSRERVGWSTIAAILLVAAVPRIWAAAWDQGLFWPDEIYQSTEQAHRFAFGYGYVSWEFRDGARSWLFPGTLGLFWMLLTRLGVTGAPALIITAKLGMVALALVGIYSSMRIAEKIAGPEAGVLAGVLSAAFPPSIVYGSRCMNEMVSAPLIAIAVLLMLDRERWKLLAAGGIAALVIYLRYQNGIITVALLGWLLAQRRGRDALAYAAGTTVVGLAGGMLDLFTWGAPFHSAVTYLRFNFIRTGFSAELGVEPLGYYFEVFWSAVGPAAIALVIGLCAAARRAPGMLAVVLVYVLAYTVVPHKEFRYLMPIAPLLLALSGIGLADLTGRLLAASAAELRPTARRSRRARVQTDERRAAAGARAGSDSPAVRTPIWVVGGVLAAAMAWRTAHATFDDFGQRGGPFSGPNVVWHAGEAVNRLLWLAGEMHDLCGLALVGYDPIFTGGYTYLHRDVPIIWMPPIDTESANYVLTQAAFALPAEYTTVAVRADAKLARRSGICAPPPDSYTRVFPKMSE